MRLLAASALLATAASALSYPPAPHDGTVDTYYGTAVADPYRPLESTEAPATQQWVEAESNLTRSYLDAIPQRATIKAHLKSLLNFENFGLPFHIRNQFFYLHTTGLQNQWALYTMQGLRGTPRVLIDPNLMSKDGSVTLGSSEPSWNARLVAYSTQTSGSDWQTWHVRSIADGNDLPDKLEWSKFSDLAWLPDSSGFLYERYPTPKANQTYKGALSDQAIYLHRIGDPESADQRFYYRPDHTNWIYNATVTEDGRYAVIAVSSSDSINNRIGYVDLHDPKRTLHELLWKNDAQWAYVTNSGPRFSFLTTLGAPNWRVVTVDLRNPEVATTLIPEAKWAIQDVSDVGRRLFVNYLVDAHSAVKVYDEAGRYERDVPLPGVGSAAGFVGFRNDRITFYSYAGWTTPSTSYTYNVTNGQSAVYRRPRIKFDPSNYVSEEAFYRSKDGTRVPMMVSYRKGTALDGNNPTILYGYGGFDIAITPRFSSFIATWLQMGGVYAVANLRGGSEYGESWHEAGMMGKKQNVFDDFIAAAEYLIANHYTSTPHLAIKGESNGGLLIGAVETQRPDLFGAALPGVGVMDILRFDKFTIGNFWASELGCSSCGKADFEWLYKYSPYANVRAGTVYPPTLIMTSDHDDRVFPAHSFKFAARMQAAQGGPAPILLRVQLKAGHAESTTLAENIDLYSDIYTFLVKNLNMRLPEGFGARDLMHRTPETGH
jgi:prolyl oligopeptidase